MVWLDSWKRCWQGLGASGSGMDVMQALLNAYDAEQRYYHTRQHLEECLTLFERFLALAEVPAEVEMALWFHDAIYDVRASDNEARSANWATATLRKVGVADEHLARINGHIMATCHAAQPQDGDQALLVDIDLAILGAAPERFAAYERQIRAEYAFVPDDIFRQKRGEILHAFLLRPRLYTTGALHDLLEEAARRNLTQTLAGWQAS